MNNLKEFKEAQIMISDNKTDDWTYDNLPSIEEAVEFVRNKIKNSARECLVAINMVSGDKAINYFIASYGDEGHTDGNYRQIAQVALLSNATKVLVIHNHPYNVLRFSEGDFDSARAMARMCDTLGLKFYDSIIVTSDNQILSMKEMGLISEYNNLTGRLSINESRYIELIKDMEEEDCLSIKETCKRIEQLEKIYGSERALRETMKYRKIVEPREGESIREYNIRVREALKKQREGN